MAGNHKQPRNRKGKFRKRNLIDRGRALARRLSKRMRRKR